MTRGLPGPHHNRHPGQVRSSRGRRDSIIPATKNDYGSSGCMKLTDPRPQPPRSGSPLSVAQIARRRRSKRSGSMRALPIRGLAAALRRSRRTGSKPHRAELHRARATVGGARDVGFIGQRYLGRQARKPRQSPTPTTCRSPLRLIAEQTTRTWKMAWRIWAPGKAGNTARCPAGSSIWATSNW